MTENNSLKDALTLPTKIEVELDVYQNRTEGKTSLVFSWTEKGFGEIAVFKEDGQWVMDGETLSRDKIKEIIGAFIDSLPRVDIRKKKIDG
jgi:hypothetical protein